MKKIAFLLAFLGFLVAPLAKAEVMGFQDGNMYDPVTGKWQCLFLMDGNCYDLNEKVITTRPPGYVAPVIVPDTTPTQTVYVPVYSTPTNQIVTTPLATGGVSAPDVTPVTPRCTLTAINQDASKDYQVTLSWTTTGIADGTKGYFLGANRYSGGVPDFDYGHPNGGTPIIAPSGHWDNVAHLYDFKATFGNVTCFAKTVEPN